MVAQPQIDQETFRFGTDGAETTHGWVAAEDTDISAGSGEDVEFGTGFFIRIRVQEQNSKEASNTTLKLQYSRNSGTWTDVNGSSSYVQSVGGTPADASTTTERLTGGTGTFIGATCYDEADGAIGGGSLDIAQAGFCEGLWSIQVIEGDVSNGDTLDLKIVEGDDTVLNNDATSDKPRISVVKAAPTASGTGWQMQGGWW